MTKKKVIIIGGGIAGLSAGIYTQKCGFSATVLESHSIPGGNCTSWKRGGYLFEGGMHWLSGSNPKEAINKAWYHVGALNDGVKIRTDEPFMVYGHNGTAIRCYRDVDQTEKHWLSLSPADAKEIKALCAKVRKLQNLSIPVTDIRGVKVTKKARSPLSTLFSLLPAMRVISACTKTSREQYASRFSHEGLREMIRAYTTGNSGILQLVFTMGVLTRGDGGFPEGGSLPFAQRMADTLTGSGGELLLNTRADKVVVKNGKAVGVVVGDKTLPADAVIVAADTMQIDHLFDVQFKADWLDEMRSVSEPTMCTLVSLGIDADLRKYPHSYYFKPQTPITIGSKTYECLSFSNYAADPVYSPKGKTAMTAILTGDTYDFWKKAKADGRYKEEKQIIADKIIAALAAKMPETAGRIEVVDVATPLTYERYCNNWKGSWMTEMLPNMKMKTYPAVIKGLDGVYFAGQRMQPPGGLPVALISGRAAVQYLCRDTGTVFVSEGGNYQ
ncbi:MAG: NAD(P)/FAD-dependent oxidoreductase [Oscillospiraceae bacterium]|nr:NAD(P)/FAD-dependent oxidoreductase [Oscillospiraceae bacterium]